MENNNEEFKFAFITSDGKEYIMNNKILNMINVTIPKMDKIPINISSFILEQFINYCEGHNYEPYTKEIKRPLNDDIKNCIENEFDSKFIESFNMDQLVLLLNASSLLNNDGLKDLCLAKIALIIRNSNIDDLFQYFNIDKEKEFSIELINKILFENEKLLAIDDDRVKELFDDDIK